MGTYLDELMNSSAADISSKLSTAKDSVDLSKLGLGTSVSSDKVFESISSSKVASNVFGVYDSKQVVQELSGDITQKFSTELIEDLDPEQLKNMATKVGSEITTDIDFNESVESIMGSMTELKQSALSFADDNFGDVVSVFTKDGAEIKATLLETLSLDDSVSSLLPQSLSLSDFSSLKDIFNSPSGIGNFNTCDALKAALGYASGLIDLNALLGNLSDLFGLLGKYDITGILSCVSEALDSLDNVQFSNLSGTLISSGSMGSYAELTSLTNNGTITNKYQTVRSIGSRSTSSQSSSFGSLFSNLGISSNEVFVARNTTGNTSILDSATIYDRSEVVSSSNAFSSYCFDDGFNETLSAIPESIL